MPEGLVNNPQPLHPLKRHQYFRILFISSQHSALQKLFLLASHLSCNENISSAYFTQAIT